MAVGGMGRERNLGRYGNTIFHGNDTADSDGSGTSGDSAKRQTCLLRHTRNQRCQSGIYIRIEELERD